jgi:hypothetical protein
MSPVVPGLLQIRELDPDPDPVTAVGELRRLDVTVGHGWLRSRCVAVHGERTDIGVGVALNQALGARRAGLTDSKQGENGCRTRAAQA